LKKDEANKNLDGEDPNFMLKIFDAKLVNVKGNLKNLHADFSSWQTTFSEQKRTIRELSHRIDAMDEQNETIDLEDIEGKA